ncbi:MAG: hypothetical protein U9R57_15855 [Thermodesulfobacteriota bacterium]|nr:hypothetical protein [Thermodesulfobacteriota bacterium]
MKTRKALVQVFAISALLLSWVSMAGAWTYSVDTYSYYGSGALTGTVPGLLYHTKVAVIHNESTESQELNVDLYYSSSFTGKYEYSPNGGTNWMVIDNTVDTWTKTIAAGGTIWLRIFLYNSVDVRFHVLSPSPWGTTHGDYADTEEYYFAFPPGSHYYAAGWVRDIGGFVAVIHPLP